MVRTRARAFAAAVALGTAVPLLAQPPADEPSFVVLPPRALTLPQVPLTSDAAEIPAGFFTPAPQPANNTRPPANNPPQSVQARPWWLTAPQSQNALNAAQGQNQRRPITPAFQFQPLTGGAPKPRGYPALTAPMTAPAWRWHGYGAVTSGDPQPTTPGAIPAANPNLNIPMSMAMPPQIVPGPAMPQPSVPIPMPTSMPMPIGESAGPPGPAALPAYSPMPAAPDASPFPPNATGDASWKPSERMGALPSNPMTADPGVVQAVATTGGAAWVPTGSPVVPAANRQVDASPIRAAFVPAAPAPPIPATTPESMTRLHSAIEKLIIGRGRDLELYQRNAASLLVRFKVRQAPEAEALANAISKIPALAGYQVVYEISVAP